MTEQQKKKRGQVDKLKKIITSNPGATLSIDTFVGGDWSLYQAPLEETKDWTGEQWDEYNNNNPFLAVSSQFSEIQGYTDALEVMAEMLGLKIEVHRIVRVRV